MSIKLLIFSLGLFFISSICTSQNLLDASIYFYEDSTKNNIILPDIKIKIDSSQIEDLLNQHLLDLYEMGYLAASYSLQHHPGSKLALNYFTDQVFEVAMLSQGNVSDEIMNKIGIDIRAIDNKPFSHRKIVSLLNSVLDYAENHGYPFASIKLDSIKIANHEISSWLNYRSGPLIVFDSLIISGYDKVKPKYLMNHFGIYKGKSYEEKLIQEIPRKINLLPFLSISESPQVMFVDGKCTVHLNLIQNNVSKIDGILGVLPNQKTDKSVLITGQLNLDLHNLFSSGKRISIEWQSFDANSQLLDMFYYHPNLLRTPINIEGDFYLLKQDTTFINRILGLDLSILSKNSSKIGFRTEFTSSRLISTYALEDVTELPDNSDYNINYYGLNYLLNRFNNQNLPTRGWKILLEGSAGKKKIIKNPAFSEEIYNGIDLNSLQIRVKGEVEKFWTIYKNVLLRTRLLGGYLEGDNLFQSDLFRVGGLRSLRGFVENEFFTSSFGVANLEIRSMFSNETYFLLFFDQAALIEDFENEDKLQYPFGTGAGFSFTTNAGIFNFIFAMGKSNNQSFGIDQSKIHFGYISRF